MNPIAPVRAVALALACLWAGGVPPVAAGTEFSPVQTLAIEARESLDIAADKVELFEDRAFILGTNAAGVDVVQSRDAQSLEVLANATLEITGSDIAVDPRGTAVYVIGDDGVNSRLVVFDAELEQIGALSIPNLLGYPVLSASPDGYLVIGALRTAYADGFFGALDVQEPGRPKFRQEFRAAEAWRGVTGAWLDARRATLFINAAWDARLLALSASKERILSEFSEDYASKGLREPYAAFPLLSTLPCRDGLATSFLVADMNNQVLTLVDYNDPFQSLETQAFVEFSLSPSRAQADRLPGADIRQPVGLISSSCDQAVTLVGSRLSREVDQFARNKGLSTLEHVGNITLPFLPSDIDVSLEREYAVIVSTEAREILRLSAVIESEEAVFESRIIGDPAIRELQRLLTEAGLPVGSIDGIIGARTLRAVALAETRFGVELEPRADIAGTLETLREAMQ